MIIFIRRVVERNLFALSQTWVLPMSSPSEEDILGLGLLLSFLDTQYRFLTQAQWTLLLRNRGVVLSKEDHYISREYFRIRRMHQVFLTKYQSNLRIACEFEKRLPSKTFQYSLHLADYNFSQVKVHELAF